MAKKNRATKNKKAKRSTISSKRNLIIATMAILAVGVVRVGAYMTTASPNKEAIGTSQESGNQNVTGKWMDIHGVGVFTAGKDNSLYVATHNDA